MTGTQESTLHIISLNLHSTANIGGKTMKTKYIYRCASYIDATDKANLYYISCNNANKIERDNAGRQIRVSGKKGIIAVFNY